MSNRDDLTPPTPAGLQPAQLSRLRCAELNRSCRYAPVRRVTLTLTSKSSHPLEALRRTRTLIPCARKISARRTSVVRLPRPRIRAITSDRFAFVQMSAIDGIIVTKAVAASGAEVGGAIAGPGREPRSILTRKGRGAVAGAASSRNVVDRR